VSSRREPDGRVPNDQEATLERARQDARAMLARGERRVVVCRSRTKAPGGWGAEIIRYFPLGQEVLGWISLRPDAVVEELRP
jgi:hypothetical protein